MRRFSLADFGLSIGAPVVFVVALALSIVAAPLATPAQQPGVPVVGFLRSTAPEDSAQIVAAFRQGLHAMGYVEGQNVAIEYRWAQGHYERLPPLAAELVRRQVAVLVASGSDPAVLAAKAATTTIPIVAVTGSDPVASALVTSLNRPGGNITGVNIFTAGLVPKRLELLCELMPQATTIAVLINPTHPDAEAYSAQARTAAHALGRQVLVLLASTDGELTAAFAALGQQHVHALLVGPDPFFLSRHGQLVALAARYTIPAIYEWREFVVAGGLISYGTSRDGLYRQVGHYTGRILNGANPAELPIEQPTEFELVVNLKTAKALSLTIPQSILIRADDVIQ